MINVSKLIEASEVEKIQMAEQAYNEYLKILGSLSDERQKVFQQNLKKLEQEKINKVRVRLQKIKN